MFIVSWDSFVGTLIMLIRFKSVTYISFENQVELNAIHCGHEDLPNQAIGSTHKPMPCQITNLNHQNKPAANQRERKEIQYWVDKQGRNFAHRFQNIRAWTKKESGLECITTL